MKQVYKRPDTFIVNVGTSVETMAGLDVVISNAGVGEEAAKEQTEFEEEDAAPTSPNLWEDEED